MRVFDYEPRVEISAASGVLCVTIEPRPSAFLMVLEAAGILLFSGFTVRQWSNLPSLWRALLIWGEACAVVAWFSQLSGSEEVLFDPEKLSSRKNTLGWERTREYSVQECSELEWKAQSRRDHPGLQCKVGWRTVHFCDYISQDQADEILAALQRNLPEVFQKMGAMPGCGKSHFTTLGLSS